jgi:hypothetical protein
MQERRYCNIASLPERVDSLERTVKSILPQVNFVKVMLNGHTEVPKFLLNNPRISYVLMNNEFADSAKFLSVEDYSGYVFTLDDDLVVPNWYCDYMIEGVKKYNAIVSLHGRTMRPKPVHSYYHGFQKVYACLSQVNEDVKVDVVGTGIMCFHTDIYTISPSDCPIPNMADVWNAKKAKELNVDLWVLKHEKDTLVHTHFQNCIYRTNHNQTDKLATTAYNSF